MMGARRSPKKASKRAPRGPQEGSRRAPERAPRGPQENPAAVKMAALVLDSRAALLGPSGNRLGALSGPQGGRTRGSPWAGEESRLPRQL